MKTLACLLVVLGGPALAAAQPPSPLADGVHVGVEGGVVLATLSAYESPDVDAAFDTGAIAGATAGLFLSLPIKGRVSLRPEVLFVQKGARLEAPGDGEVAVVHLLYAELPVLLHVEGAGRSRPFLNLGPAFAFKTRARVDLSASGGPSDIDVGSDVRSFDVAAAVGGGFASGRWSVEVRFVQGLIDIGNTLRVGDVIRTRTISTLAAIRF